MSCTQLERQLSWNIRRVVLDAGGLGSGVYLYRLQLGGQEAVGRVVLAQ